MGKLSSFRSWFEKRLDDAIQAAEMEQQQQKGGGGGNEEVKHAVGSGTGGGGGDGGDGDKAPSNAKVQQSTGPKTEGGRSSSAKSTTSSGPRKKSFFNEEHLKGLPDPPFPLSAYGRSQQISNAGAQLLEVWTLQTVFRLPPFLGESALSTVALDCSSLVVFGIVGFFSFASVSPPSTFTPSRVWFVG